jgi:asparagine synthase (glutamine-hydrolysing)
MSGIVGLLNTDGAPLDEALLRRMTAAMAFRGPDARHLWANGRVGLGHTLFRTGLESEQERQPCSLGDDVWIAADVRIDGRADLVQRLRDRGRDVVAAAPDAELILHAYLVWGDRGLDHLIGDFAFVLWDGRQERLLAGRDQLGVAQLFYSQAGGTLLLGNTLNSLLVHPRVADTLDKQTLADVALFLTPLDDAATGYSAIRRLPPGCKLVCDRDGLRVDRYWTLREPACRVRYRRPEEYAEHFRLLFDEAVGDRLRTARAGCQLSGGMDSSSIAVAAHRRLQASGHPFELRAFSIEYPTLIPDEEGRLAAQVAAHSGFAVEVLNGETYLRAEPPADPTWLPPEPGAVTLWVMEEVCRRTAAFAPVLLTGYGGDPLLAPPALSWHRAWAALRHGAWKWPARELAALARQRRPPQPGPLPAWVNGRWARDLDLAERATLNRHRAQREQRGMAGAPLWRALFAWSDAGYNGRPLSIRFPFFDLRLIEFVLAIPPVPWLDDKHLLRAAMGERLPEGVRTRPKTVMPGDVTLEQQRHAGVPRWQVDLLAAPEMAGYVDSHWLGAVQRASPGAQAEIWAKERPPVELAYWLSRRPAWRRSAGPEWHYLTGEPSVQLLGRGGNAALGE